MASLSAADVVIVVVSLCLVFATAVIGARLSGAKNEADEYFLAGRSMPWTIIAASLFASNIGTEHFVGQAGAAATDGIALSLYEWTASYVILLLGWVFAPVYLSAKLKTIPEYLERRFNSHCRYLFVLLTLVAYVVTKIGGALYAGGIILDVVAGLNIWQSTPIIIIATASYTITGGLTAVMLTDTIQTLIFLFGGLMGTGFALNLVGGMNSMFDKLRSNEIRLDRLTHAIRPANDTAVPGIGLLLGIPVVSLWYWCIDQEMAQRILSAKSLNHARTGSAAAALLKIIPPFITVVPGLVARTLFELCRADDTGTTYPQWCQTDLSDAKEADKAYPLMVLREFPNGVKGIIVASFLAAMMSSLSSVYNSASTVFTYDIYERFFAPEGGSSAQRLVTVGRWVTVCLTLFTFIWLPVVESSSRGLYIVGQEAMSHIVPTVSAVFFCGFLVPFANGVAALTGMVIGVALGIIRVIPYFLLQDYCDRRVDSVTQAQRLNVVNWTVCLNFSYFATLLFFVVIAIICIVGYFTERPRESQIAGLLSEIVQKRASKDATADAIQLTSVQYNIMQESDQPDLNAATGDDQGESTYPLQIAPNSSFQQNLTAVFRVEDGYAAHILSVMALIGITTLIVVYH